MIPERGIFLFLHGKEEEEGRHTIKGAAHFLQLTGHYVRKGPSGSPGSSPILSLSFFYFLDRGRHVVVEIPPVF